MSISTDKPSILIIDSFALLFRGYFAMALSGNEMKTSYGLYTNGLYQFTKYMMHAIETYEPSHVICAFDMGSSTFRNEMYADYKANRDAPPEQLIPQFDKLWELVDAFDIPCVGKQGFEADDVIGSLSRRFSAEGLQVKILTGDGDSLQLIDERVSVSLMKRGFGNYLVVNADNLKEIRGIDRPDQIIEMKALMGDASDNIPGCPNVGEKTALKLIEQFDTVDGVYDNIDQLKGKLKERLIEFKDQVYLSRDLATIRTDLDIDCPLERCEYAVNLDKLRDKLMEFEFRGLLKTIAG